MRRIGVFALVLVAGCSLVWNMDSYDSTGRDAGAANDAMSTSSSGSGASSSGVDSSSGSNGSVATFDAGDASLLEGGTGGFDAATAPCGDEQEPNDEPAEATEAVGRVCGVFPTITDEDWFFVMVESGTKTIFIDIGVNVRVFVEYQSGGGVWSQTPGAKTTTLPTGLSMIHFEPTGAQPGGTYSLTVP
jgi:hypothetical protein